MRKMNMREKFANGVYTMDYLKALKEMAKDVFWQNLQMIAFDIMVTDTPEDDILSVNEDFKKIVSYRDFADIDQGTELIAELIAQRDPQLSDVVMEHVCVNIFTQKCFLDQFADEIVVFMDIEESVINERNKNNKKE